MVRDSERHIVSRACNFFESGTSPIDHQSDPTCVTLSLNNKCFEKMEEICRDEVKEGEKMLSIIAAPTHIKLKHYAPLGNTQAAKFAKVVDSCIQADILSDAPILRHFGFLDPCNMSHDVAALPEHTKLSFMEEIWNGNSCNLVDDDEIIKILSTTANTGKRASFMQLRKGHYDASKKLLPLPDMVWLCRQLQWLVSLPFAPLDASSIMSAIAYLTKQSEPACARGHEEVLHKQ